MKIQEFDRKFSGFFPVPVIPALVAAALSVVALWQEAKRFDC